MARYQCQNCQTTFDAQVTTCPVCGARQAPVDLERRAMPLVGWGCSGLGLIVLVLIAYALFQGPADGQTWAQHLTSGALVLALCGLPPVATGVLFLYLWRRGR